MKRFLAPFLILVQGLVFLININAQIYEPEGLNMPGDWDSWNNPPTNLVLANPNQTSGGLLVKLNNEVPRWTTTFQVEASGADFSAGTYAWLFTSGPDPNYFQNKWADVNVVIDQLQTYTLGGTNDNSITIDNGYWCTMVWVDSGYGNTRAIFMKTSEEPVNIANVSEPTDVNENEPVEITFNLSASPCTEEVFYIQYTTDAWTTSNLIAANVTGTSGSASIPGQAESTIVEYHVFSSSVSGLTADGFLHAIRINDNNELNYTYTVGEALPPEISWCNLQWPPAGEIQPGNEYVVYGRVFIYNVTEQTDPVTDLQCWVGYSTTDSDPSTWTNWISAPFFGNVGNDDEYAVDLGAVMNTEGTYFYATRFKYLDQDYVYGGYSESGGDIWDGTDYVSGELTVTNVPTPDEITWANLQWPAEGEIEPEQDYNVYGRVYIEDITSGTDPVTDLQCWIGYSTTDTDPSTWTNWIAADFSSNQGNNDEYVANLGAEMDAEGTFYYATRFQYLDQDYVYGGYSETEGGFWDGTNNVSGVLVVTTVPTPDEITWANLQWPAEGEIEPEQDYNVYGRVYIEDITSGTDPVADLQCWVGYSTTDTDPSTWTNWIAADFSSNQGNNDEYVANLGAEMDAEGTFYYATRFQYLDQDYVYGGYSETEGGFWDGTNNVSGVLVVTTVPTPDEITWANLQWPADGEIEPEQDYNVYGRVYIEDITSGTDPVTDLQCWVGYSTTDTDPSTWTNWIAADFSSNQGNNDEYVANLGAEMDAEGTFYYATRFQYLDQDYVYGGYSETEGGFWDGTNNVSGVLVVTTVPTPDEITWANLQWPAEGEIEPEQDYNVYGRVYIEDITSGTDPVADLQCWIGYSTTDTDPSTWTNWIAADFSSNQGNNDEYVANLGAEMDAEGTFYYATRFQYLDQDYVYGGYSETEGGFWDGTNNVSGVLVVTTVPTPDEITWANLQWPPVGNIEIGEDFTVYGRVYIEDITNGTEPVVDLQCWIGYNDTDSDPSTWSNWILADFSSNQGNNDEYSGEIGSEMTTAGTYYYATRFKYLDQEYVYGGYSASDGGFWDGTNNVSGVLTVSEPMPDEIAWANLQWPPSGEILPNESFIVYGRVWIEDVTSQADSLTDLFAWVGYSETNTDPSTWTNWIPAWYLGEDGDNDEFTADLGLEMSSQGTYYYATRFQYLDQDYVYGGYSPAGGDFWDGTENVSGVLTVTDNPAPDTIGWCNLQHPAIGFIEPNEEFNVYGRVWIDGVTTQSDSVLNLQAWIGYNENNTDPSTWTNWIPAWFAGNQGANDEYVGDLGSIMDSEGFYYYAMRYQFEDQDYVYGGFSEIGGNFWDGTDNISGELIIEEDIVAYNVEFVVTDATGLYDDIKLKGEMTNWNWVDMTQNGADWSASLEIFPGTYEWGVLEDDGSPEGLWLIIGDNLVVTVDDQGNISGDTNYTITLVGIEENYSGLDIYPNPIEDQLWINRTSSNPILIRIMDSGGKLIQQNTSTDQKIEIDVMNWSKGLYLIELSEGNQVFRTKLIKQ